MESGIRMIRKRFKCSKCESKQGKLVRADDILASCENCNGLMREISDEEYNKKTRDQINQNYRLVFDENNKKQYHSRFDANDTRNSNLEGESNKKISREENTNKAGSNRHRPENNFSNSGSSNTFSNRNSGRNFNNQANYNNYSRRNENNLGSSSKRGFRNNNIYEPEEYFNSQFRSSSPQNNNFYNYHQNNSRRYNHRQEEYNYSQRRATNFTNGFEDIFSNFFGSSNNNSNSNRRSQNNQNDFFGNFFSGLNQNFPFGESPFLGRINRHHFNEDIFDPGFQTFGSSFNNFFQDNFASNFRSNFRSQENFFDIFNIIRTRNENQPKHPPTHKEAIKNLKKFKMNDKYCKKNEKGQMEMPSCSICISDMAKGDETLLLPCGHMYHSGCAMPWLKNNNTCPVCRFELPPQN
jgi:E3 ubiquitin-protein ligase RNF115/126